MARRIGPKHKLCRKFQEKLCDSDKCAILKRKTAPGVHGATAQRNKLSGYGKQLREKQKVKFIYGILERQFSNYVAEASKKTGDTGKFLISYLESRLDNFVYRMGLAKTRPAARQLVGHGHILVNGKKVDIASYRVKIGEVVSLSERARKDKSFEQISERMAKVEAPGWLTIDAKAVSAKILNTPTVENPNFNAKSIIEFYSR